MKFFEYFGRLHKLREELWNYKLIKITVLILPRQLETLTSDQSSIGMSDHVVFKIKNVEIGSDDIIH